MLNGLQSATEKWKKVSKERRVELICPICNKSFFLPKHLSKNRTYCSTECSIIGNANVSRDNFKLAAQRNIELKSERKTIISSLVYEWSINNQNIVLDCPKNKISTNLSELKLIIEKSVGIKDWRTICESVGVKNKKDFLKAIQDYIHENIC